MLIFILSFLISFLLSALAWKVFPKFGFVDRPGGLKNHRKPKPYGGGIAIFIASLVVLLKGYDWRIVSLGGVLFLVGLVDDLKGLSRYVKLFFQFAVATVTIYLGIRMQVVYFPGWVNITLSVLWIVGITNAFNIIDVMDGIAGGTGFFAALTFLLISIGGGMEPPLLSMGITGACLGFLPLNLPKAKLYMGDAGSYFLGFSLSVVALKTSYTSSNPIALFVPLLILFYPIYDTTYVVILRIIKNKNPLRGSNDHFVLKLSASGLSTPTVVAIIYLATIALCEASYIITGLSLTNAVLVYSLAVVTAGIFGVILWRET